MTQGRSSAPRRHTDEQIVAGYEILFSERVRAAQRAAMDYARLTEPDEWPTLRIVKRFAQAFDVPADVLGAGFGILTWLDGETYRVADVFRRPASRVRARDMLSREQARAYGWFLAFEAGVRKKVLAAAELH